MTTQPQRRHSSFRYERALGVVLCLLAASASPSVNAQWLNYPVPGVPRTKAGAVNMTAPAPRINGKPDLSGIWEAEDNRPCPAGGCLDMKVGQEFVNIGWSLTGGLPYQPWAAELTKQRTSENRLHDPMSKCLPPGIVRLHTHALMRKMVQTPTLLAILNEQSVWYRQIMLDGRPLPVDPVPTWNGYSVGQWEGDTLVVVSNGFRDDLWLDANGSPMTSAAKITERFRRPDFGHLEIALTVDDPKAYTRPWTVTLRQTIVADSDLLDYVCQENEKDVPHLIGK
jgi:hypothetical protein